MAVNWKVIEKLYKFTFYHCWSEVAIWPYRDQISVVDFTNMKVAIPIFSNLKFAIFMIFVLEICVNLTTNDFLKWKMSSYMNYIQHQLQFGSSWFPHLYLKVCQLNYRTTPSLFLHDGYGQFFLKQSTKIQEIYALKFGLISWLCYLVLHVHVRCLKIWQIYFYKKILQFFLFNKVYRYQLFESLNPLIEMVPNQQFKSI